MSILTDSEYKVMALMSLMSLLVKLSILTRAEWRKQDEYDYVNRVK